MCRWVNKLKPVFDAYAGPYEDRYRMWTGLLLVLRTLLIFLFSLNITGSPNFKYSVVLILSLVMLLLNTRGIYKIWQYNVLEAFFYVQLVIFSGGILLYGAHHNSRMSVLANFSFASVLFVFLVTVGYRAFFSFRKVIFCCNNEEALDPEEEEQLLFRDRETGSTSLSHPCN